MTWLRANRCSFTRFILAPLKPIACQFHDQELDSLSFFFVNFFTICFTSGLTALSNSGVLAATKPITAVDTIVETSGMY